MIYYWVYFQREIIKHYSKHELFECIMVIPNIESKTDLDSLFEQLYFNPTIRQWAFYKSKTWILVGLNECYTKIDKIVFSAIIKYRNLVEMIHSKTNW